MAIQPNASIVLGPITVHTYGPEQTDPETGVVFRPVTGTVPGSHWNIARDRMTPNLAPYEVTPDPSTPAVVWGGDVRLENGTWRDTAFLVFPDEETALAALLAAGLASDVPA